ncbi:HTH-type transcriptional regulator BetI [Sphingobium sp. AntQ-1]|uniref:TetR/AcrR family transcriptional regulator n=1 Tax=Sphingobium sp. AntQ-1 TaxID=2930091 RepID=UPI00234F4E64|nr:TetR family transcriptional regulator [Sphingobium sp. AntQ-1]WCP15323.1 HTH-type transcriptional regulator BetI [Sphingobium sp. AntQ-1]
MHDRLAPSMEAQYSSKDRIIDAVLGLWEDVGGTGLSVRTIARAADVPVSSLYHHFGSLEQLFVIAQDHARLSAAAWRDRHLHGLQGARLDAMAFPPVFAALVDDWACAQRRLAFAWREGQQLAVRDPGFQEGAMRWTHMWVDMWREIGAHFGLEDSGALTARLFDSESFLHMINWRRMVDRAGLDEFARGWTAWLCGRAIPDAPFRDFARAQAQREFPALPERDETAGRIAAAAAAIVSRKGAGSMTHRAVAAEAGLTLGVVSHKFRTSADLMRAAFDSLYLGNVPATGSAVAPVVDDHWSLGDLVQLLQRSAASAGPEELTIVVARDPSYRHFAAQLRYLRGRTSGRYLQAFLGPDHPISELEAALFSGFLAGQIRAQLAAPGYQSPDRVHQELEQLLALIARRVVSP